VEEDIEEMRAEERAQQAEATISMMELICSPTLRSPLIIGVVMQLSQQLSGINAVSPLKFYVLMGDIWTKLGKRRNK
jgi:SP family facilitated glucose transporter-like MFS transporter 1